MEVLVGHHSKLSRVPCPKTLAFSEIGPCLQFLGSDQGKQHYLILFWESPKLPSQQSKSFLMPGSLCLSIWLGVLWFQDTILSLMGTWFVWGLWRQRLIPDSWDLECVLVCYGFIFWQFSFLSAFVLGFSHLGFIQVSLISGFSQVHFCVNFEPILKIHV